MSITTCLSGVRVGVAASLGIALTSLAVWACTSAQGEPRAAEGVDPFSGEIADGTARALTPLPSVVFWLGRGEAVVVEIAHEDANPPETSRPRLVSYRACIADDAALPRGADIIAGAVLKQGLYKNLGPSDITVTYMTDEHAELQEAVLAPGFGILVGSLDPIASSHVWGCLCTCTDAAGGWERISLACSQEDGTVDPAQQSPPDCHCEVYDNHACALDDNQVIGTSSDCRRALILE